MIQEYAMMNETQLEAKRQELRNELQSFMTEIKGSNLKADDDRYQQIAERVQSIDAELGMIQLCFMDIDSIKAGPRSFGHID